MLKSFFVFQCILFFFVSFKAYSLTSSSYLIANSAMLFIDYEEANIHYDIIDTNKLNNNDLEKKLLAYVNTNSFNKALVVAEAILQNDKTNQEAWLVYLIDAKLNNIQKPFNDFQKIKKNENLTTVEFIFNNDSFLKNNDDEMAQSILGIVNESLMQNSNQPQNYNYLIFYLSLSLKLNKAFNEAYFYSAQLYQNLKKYKKAEEFYNKIENDHSLYLESQINIAINKSYEKKLEEAEKNLIFLLNSKPQNERVLVALADLYRTSKQYKKAIQVYSKTLNHLSIDKNQKWNLLYKRGICYERLDNWKSAENDFLLALEINSELPRVLNYLAYGWIERNIFLDRSLEMLKIANKNNPESYYILDSLAWAYFKKNNFIKASELMEEVINRAPGEAISLDHLGDIYFSMGRKREALYMWKQAKDLAEPEDNILDKLEIKLNKYNAG